MIEVMKLELNPNDMLVVKVDCILNNEAKEKIKQEVGEWAGDIPVLVLDSKVSLTVINKIIGGLMPPSKY